MGKHRALYLNHFEEWDTFVDIGLGGNIFSKSWWLRAVSEALGSDFKVLGVLENERLVGGVGLNILSLPLIGKVVTCPLLTPYNSVVIIPKKTKNKDKILLHNEKIMTAISEKLKKDYESVSVVNHPNINDIRPFQWQGWKEKVRYTYFINIEDPDQLWKEFSNNVRTRIRKCYREGVKVEKSNDDRLFFELFQCVFERKNMISPVMKDQFHKIFNALNENVKIYFAKLGKEAISAMAVIMDRKGIAHEWQAGTKPEYLKLGVAQFLRWKVIEDLSSQNYRVFDLNGGGQKSIALSKSQFGGYLIPYFEVNFKSYYIYMLEKGWNSLKRFKLVQLLRRDLWQ